MWALRLSPAEVKSLYNYIDRRNRKKGKHEGPSPQLPLPATASYDASADRTVFGFDVKKVQGHKVGTCFQLLAAHVCLVMMDSNGREKVMMDRYVKYQRHEVTDLLSDYSHMTWQAIDQGDDINNVRKDFLALVRDSILLMVAGNNDLKSMGLLPFHLREVNCERVELQNYFVRDDGTKCGLASLVDFFEYKNPDNSPVIISHNCAQDADYTLRVYNDKYDPDVYFTHERPILTGAQYKK